MDRAQVARLFQECYQRMERGESLQSVLASYPEHEDFLAPMLRAAAYDLNHKKDQPDLVVKQSGLERLERSIESWKGVSALDQPEPVESRHSTGLDPIRTTAVTTGRSFWVPRYALVLIAVLMILGSGFFTLSASAQSLPGDSLYPVKRSVETLRLAAARDEGVRSALVQDFRQRRLVEVEQLLSRRRSEKVEFSGQLVKGGDGSYTISGYQVTIPPEIELNGISEVAGRVRVAAVTQEDGRLVAESITSSGGDEAEPGDDLDQPEEDGGGPAPAAAVEQDEPGEHEGFPGKGKPGRDDQPSEELTGRAENEGQGGGGGVSADEGEAEGESEGEDEGEKENKAPGPPPWAGDAAPEVVPEVVEERVPEMVEEKIPDHAKGKGPDSAGKPEKD